MIHIEQVIGPCRKDTFEMVLRVAALIGKTIGFEHESSLASAELSQGERGLSIGR